MSEPLDPVTLPENWYTYCVKDGVDVGRPGIYEWRIDGVGSYIGQYRWISRPTKHYGRNLIKLFKGIPYRNRSPDGFRRIHRELAKAHREGRRIKLIIVENVETKIERNRRERELIGECGNLNGSISRHQISNETLFSLRQDGQSGGASPHWNRHGHDRP